MLACEHLHCREWGKMLIIPLFPTDATQGFWGIPRAELECAAHADSPALANFPEGVEG